MEFSITITNTKESGGLAIIAHTRCQPLISLLLSLTSSRMHAM